MIYGSCMYIMTNFMDIFRILTHGKIIFEPKILGSENTRHPPIHFNTIPLCGLIKFQRYSYRQFHSQLILLSSILRSVLGPNSSHFIVYI